MELVDGWGEGLEFELEDWLYGRFELEDEIVVSLVWVLEPPSVADDSAAYEFNKIRVYLVSI